MDLHQLQIFKAVLTHSSVTKAAKVLYLSPAAVSLQIRNLREELGVDLFVKSGRSLMATPDAHRLGQQVAQLLDLADGIRHSFRADEADREPFRLAAGFTAMVYQLSPLLDDLRSLLPHNDVELTISQTEHIVEGVHGRRFDLGVVTMSLPAHSVRVSPLFTERFAIIVGDQLRRLAPAKCDVSHLKDLPWILYTPDTNIRHLIDQSFRKAEIIPRVVIEQNNVEAIKSLVAANFGASLLPESCLISRVEGLSRLPVKGFRLERQVGLAEAQTDHSRKATVLVSQFLRRHLQRSQRLAPTP